MISISARLAKYWRVIPLVLLLIVTQQGIAQTFKYKTSSASNIVTAHQLYAHGFPDTIITWCNDWDAIIAPPLTWQNNFKLKSNQSFVKFYIDHCYPKTQLPYTYQLVYTVFGYTSFSDTTANVINNDTLTITNFDHSDPKNAFQDIQLAKYGNYYKTMVVLHGIYANTGGIPSLISLSDSLRWNFNIEGSILTQRYDKTNYGVGTSLETSQVPDPTNNILNVYFNLPGGTTPVQLTPVNFELEWTYIDDYQRDLSSGTVSEQSLSSLQYNFTNNSTRVWLDSSHYRIPIVYPNGYIAYRVRMVRPDSVLFKYPIYSDWSYNIADAGSLSALNSSYPSAVYHISDAYTHDSLNWQYTISFAEGGKYKHVLSFYDGLLKNRESITRFNSNLNKLIVTKNIYDFEGRPSIKTLPAPVSTSTFAFQQNVDINSVTGLPYRAADFDTGWHICPGDPVLSPMASYALGNIYYSSNNPDTTGYQRYVPDAGGYPLIQTIYSPAFNDRVEKQGGAGPRLQIPDSNIISNYYVTTGQMVLNRLFGVNAGWNNYYNMTISRDPNMQLSMSIKSYEGKQVASSLIGPGGNPVDHAIDPVDVPSPIYYQEDILKSLPQSVIDNRRIADKDFFNEVEGNDSVRYSYQFTPYPVCPSQYLSVQAHYSYEVTDQCGDTVFAQDSTLGTTGVVSSPATFSGSGTLMHLGVGPYSVHKELLIREDDVEAALDSFFDAPPNCLKAEPWFIRQSVESKHFPCPFQDDDPCSIKKAQMIKDLIAGGTYAGFTIGPDGHAIGTPPSIFEFHPKPCGDCPGGSAGGYSHYTYQDSCIIMRIPDTITISGIQYYHLRSMSVDSFIMVYNLAIAAGNTSIAEALLPLHPEYCALKACITDTFKTLLLSIPNAHVAENLHLLYLDSIIAHDPLVGILSGYASTADSLATYPGGHYRLDYPEFLKLYCGCSDSVMLKECVMHIFNNEINNRVLVTDALKQQYFSDMVNVYLQNRQRFVDAYITTGAGDSCMVCDSARLPMSTTTGGVFPSVITSTGAPGASFFGGAWDTISTTGSWLLGAMGSIGAPMDSATTAIYLDSATTIYTAADSTMCHGAIDSIVGHLFNCGNSLPAVISSIHYTLDSLCSAHIIHNGDFTPDIIRYVIQRSGAPFDDFCNPYLVSFGLHPAAAPGTSGCKSDSFYVSTTRYLNKSAVLNSLIHPGTSYHDTLRYLTNSFEQSIYQGLGDNAFVITEADYDPANTLYTIHVYNDPALGLTDLDTVKIYLRSTGTCAGVFAAGTTGDSLAFADVICPNEASPGFISGFINEFSFVAHVNDYHDTTVHTCTMLGWTDSVQTMADRDNNIADCIPCTQMRSLYKEFTDTLASYGIVGSDHPMYEDMLLHFMNYRLPNTFESYQYDRFITSCALADSTFMKLYVGYANFKFANDVDANYFISALDGVDPDISFDNDVYRDSSASGVTVSVDLSIVPTWKLAAYRTAIISYSLPVGASRIVNAGLSTFQGDSIVGIVYAYPGSPMPTPAAVFGTGTTLHFSPVETRGIWMGTGYATQDFYYLVDQPSVTRPYEVSAGVYELQRYFINNSIGATLVSNYQSTVNKDYFKQHKKDYLTYTYQYQPLPPYKVLDSIQAQYLVTRIPSYAESDATYQHPFNPTIITNLYLSDSSMVNNYFDTLRYILQTVASDNIVNPGFTFFDTNKVVVHATIDSPLIAYRCSDGTYWYRYFGNGDTLYNVYVAMPKWIPTWQHKYYRIISIGPPTGITPALGDSLSRFFTLNLRRDGDTAVIQAKGMTTFVIARNEVLSNVLLGNPLTTVSAAPPTDTFNNCERQLLNSGIREGVVAYQVYMDSVRSAIRNGFIAFMLDHVKEQLIIGYQTNEFNYTLYYYDRAGNLSATVPPAGLNPLPMTSLDAVDGERTAGTASSSVIASHNKTSTYNYNSVNQVVVQTTPDAGETRFFYDAANRLICAQNAKQAPTGYCTYNLYDKQNRIIETGEAKLLCPYFSEYTITSTSPLPSCYFTYPGMYGPIASPYSPVIKNLKVWPQDSVISYIRSQNRRDVVVTVYDTANTNLHALAGLDAQENLRKRVSCAKFFEYLSASDVYQSFYTYATHYSYDIEGNVKCLVQDFPSLDHLGERYKRVDYDYDLISGKVNLLSYNRSFSDQYYQRYSYDDDNRITKVETSGDGIIWHRDAEYSYYQHGPLARIDAGDLRIQGIDFAYTIQGWLKIMNADSLDSHMDMGQDANVAINAKDAVAYAIDYFKNDYKPITSWQNSHVADESRSLYNGNISRQTMAIADFRRLNKQYVYDQLNRIKSAQYATVTPVDGSLASTSEFANSYTYDADGNINTLKRYGNNTGTGALIMDSLFYTYGTGVGGYSLNQLKSLTDMAADSYSNDIKYNGGSPAATHYAYDAIGNTTRDVISGQDTIKWNLYNKVVETRNSSANNFMDFKYDAAGNRVAKYFTTTASTGNTEDNNYYVRDAQGNILAIYHEKVQYKVVPFDWIHYIHEDYILDGGTTWGYVHFVATDFGNLSSFTGAVLPHAISNNNFLHSIIDRPVSYYMQQDNSIYADLTQGMIEWVPKILDMDRQNNTTVVSDAMVKAAAADPQNLYGVMMALTSDPNLFLQVMNVMCNAGLDSFVNGFTDPNGNNGFLPCFDRINVFQNQGEPWLMAQDQKDAMNVVNNMISAANLYPSQFATFLSGLAYDPITVDIVNNNPNSPYYPALQPVVSNFGDRSAIYSYFDNDGDEAQQQLDRVADDSRKLNICYNDCQECFLSAFDSVLADNYIDSAIALTSGLLPPQPYASRLSNLTGVNVIESIGTTTSVSLNSYGLAEHDFYGSSRLGVKNYWPGQVGLLWDYDHSIFDTIAYKQRRPWYSMEYQDMIKDTARDLYGNTHITKYLTQHLTGQKQYEVTDHLGDVLATLSDARMPVPPTSDTTTGYTIASYAPVIKTAYDYYPFGMYMPGRYTEDTQMHCTTTTSLVMVPTTTSTWVPWYWTDVLYVGQPTVSSLGQDGGLVLNTHVRGDGISYSNLIAGTGKPIPIQLSYEQANVDFMAYVIEDGQKVLTSQILHAGTRGTVSLDYTSTGSAVSIVVSSLYDGENLIWLHGHWVTTTTYTPRYVTTNVCSDDQYRYGYNGQMKVNEWAGVGNHTTAKWWEYDSRTGRRANIDPKFKKFPGISPYATNGDNPIQNMDAQGDELAAAGVGFIVGSVISLGKSIHDKGLKGAFANGEWKKTLGHAVTAGAVGGLIGLTNGAAAAWVTPTVAFGASATGSMVDDKIDGQDPNVGKAVLHGLVSAGTAGFGKYLGNVVKGGAPTKASAALIKLYKNTGTGLERAIDGTDGAINWGIDKAFEEKPIEITLPEITIHVKRKDNGN